MKEQGSPGADPSPQGPSAGAALVLALFSLLCAPCAATWSNPPEIYPGWLGVGFLSIAAMIMALRASAYSLCSRAAGARIAAGCAFPPALLALSAPVLSYYESFHDFPWAVVFPVLLMLAWGGWQWGQRWLSGVIVLLLWIGGYGLLPPHTPGLPRTATVGDLTVTLRSLKRTQRVLFCDFDLTTASGEPLANRCVLNTIQCEGQAFHFLPVPGWRAHEWPREKGQSDREAHLSAWLFPPEWVRSVDLTLKVQTWPSSPACSVSFAVPPHGKAREGEIHAAGEGMKLAVSDVRWSPSWTRGPQEEVLAVRVSYSGYSYSGWTGRELRVTDEAGGALDFGCGSIAGTEGGATLNGEVVAVPRGVRRIVVQAFSEKQLEEGERVYRFTRLPNATRE